MDDQTQFWLNWLVNLAIAIGTVGAVVWAVFGQWIFARFFPPRLVVSFRNPLGVATPVTLHPPDGQGEPRTEKGRYYHLRVSNAMRWRPATQVEVVLLQIEEPGLGGEMITSWIGEVPLQWSLQEIRPLRQTIGAAIDCNLCAVVKDKWIELLPLVRPFNLMELVRRRGPTHLIVTVQAQSVEGNSMPLRLRIVWDGKWADGELEMAAHCRIEPA